MTTKPKPPQPPKHLTATTKEWFDSVVAEFRLERHHLLLLTLACEARDRGEQARASLQKTGLTFADRFGQPHARPEVAIERDSRAAFARLLREMGLDSVGSGESPVMNRIGS